MRATVFERRGERTKEWWERERERVKDREREGEREREREREQRWEELRVGIEDLRQQIYPGSRYQ